MLANISRRALTSGAAVAALLVTGSAVAQERSFDVPAQPATKSIPEFAKQAGIQIVAPGKKLRGLQTPSLEGSYDVRTALQMLIRRSSLKIAHDDGATITLAQAAQVAPAAPAAKVRPPAEPTRIAVALAVPPQVEDVQRADPIDQDTDIVVTATRREQHSQDVGIALSVLGEQSIERRGIQDFAAYAQAMPGLAFADRGPGQQLITTRGVSASTSVVNTDEPESQTTTAIFFDETPVSFNGFNPDLRLFDIQRVEVLRGPQGTLFGSGALAGAIRIISNPPSFDYEGKVQGRFSVTQHGGANYVLNVMANIPLIDNVLALRLTGGFRDNSGFIDNIAPQIDPRFPAAGVNTTGPVFKETKDMNDERTFTGRAQLLFTPNEALSVNLRLYHQTMKVGGTQSEDTFDPADPLPGNNPNDALVGPFQQSRLLPEPYKDRFTIIAGQLDYDFGPAELTSVTSWLDRNTIGDFESTDFFTAVFDLNSPGLIRNITATRSIVQEIRLTSQDEGPFSWIVGGYYENQKVAFTQDAPIFGLGDESEARFGDRFYLCNLLACPIPGSSDNVYEGTLTRRTRQLAVFADVGLKLTEWAKLSGGARYYDYRQKIKSEGAAGALQAGVPVNADRISENGFNPRLQVELTPAENFLIYASVARGFRLGGVNDPIPAIFGGNIATFDSDSLWSYELGLKSNPSRAIQLNAAVFRTDWSNPQITGSVGNGAFGVTVNGPDIRVWGFEAEAVLKPVQGLSVSLSTSYTNSTYKVTGPLPGGVDVLDIVDGQRTPIVPKWTFGADVAYYFPLADRLEGVISANASYRGSSWNRTERSLRVLMPSYVLANAKIGVETPQWSASLFADNLFNKRAVLFEDTIFLLHNRTSVNRPRTIGAEIVAKF